MDVIIYFGLKAMAAVILTEALTELAVKSEFFYPLRKFLFKSKNSVLNFIHQIFDCGYCFSVWAGMLSTACLFYIDNPVLNYMIIGLIVHRLSNLLHNVIDKLKSNAD